MIKTANEVGVLRLVLDRPELGNALNDAVVDALSVALSAAFADDSVHTVVLEGSGRHFCTGFDLSDLATVSDGDLLARFVRIESLLQLLWHAPIRTVACARGRTFGAGADLLACCDLRLASPEATFTFPGVRFGLVLGSRRLAERMGVDRARRCLLEGETLTATTAREAGLASDILDGTLDDWCREVLAPPVADRAAVAGILGVSRADWRDADMAALVRSAVRPRLRQRIEAYRASLQAQRETR